MHSLSSRIVLALALTILSAPGGRAATFLVNTTADGDDGACSASPAGCTLHEAIEASVAASGRDTITFDPAVFPLGAPGVIALATSLPVLADPAGTVVDGAGAGVIVQPGGGLGLIVDGLVFASGSDAALANIRVANVTVRDFAGTAIVICGGDYPACAGDVTKPVVENVFVNDTGMAGVRIRGRDVTKARLTNVVASFNVQGGILLTASGALVGTRIDGCTARQVGLQNGESGILLTSPVAITSTTITSSIGVGNGGPAVRIRSEGALSKVKLTKVVATKNVASGIVITAVGAASDITLVDVVSVDNETDGVALFGDSVTGTTVKGLVANRNGSDGLRITSFATLTGAKITNVRALGNEGAGIEIPVGDVSGVQVSRIVVSRNEGIGLRLRGSGHVLKRVRADSNGAGIHLDAPGSGNVIEQCTAHANDGPPGGAGIRIASGNTGNVIRKNAAQLNDGLNLEDGNANCDGNVWSDNFAVTNAACLD